MSETMVPVMTMTDQGANLVARSVAQEKLYITRLAMGDGQMANVGSIHGLTALIHERVSVPITKTTRKDNKLTVFGPVSLAANTPTFRWRELGVFGHIGTEAEVLIGYLHKGDTGEMVDPADGVERSIYITLEIDPAAKVEVVLAPRGSIDWEQINDPPATYPPSAHNHSAGDITSGVLPVIRGGTGKDTALTADDVGASPSGHTHTPTSIGAAEKSHTHTPTSIGAAEKGHTHTPASIGAAEKSHTHTPTSIGAAEKDHTHTPSSLGAAPSSHTHKVSEVSGAAPTESPSFTGTFSHNRKPGNGVGEYSAVFGDFCTASGEAATAEGEECIASGDKSHAGGHYCYAEEFGSFAFGVELTATNAGGMVIGYGNRPVSHNTGLNQSGDAFVIGNNPTESHNGSNAFRVTYAGAVYGTGQFQTSGADYAEFFEWGDGNPEGQDRVGLFVTLEGQKIKLARPGDYILGIVSGNPCIVGNADEDWLGRWLHDDFNRFVREYLEESEEPVNIPAELEGDALRQYLQENRILERDGAYFKRTVTVVDHETTKWRYKENPDYDHTQPYIERKDRKEWDCVGMLGVLAVWDNGTCQVNGFCQVAEGGIATAAEDYVPGLTYRVIERVTDNIVKVVFR